MQDNYVGDIGDYGKYGLLREINNAGLSLGVNWYRVVPKKVGKQDDGKYVDYLKNPSLYRHYDTELYDYLHKLVFVEKARKIDRINKSQLIHASFYSKEVGVDRILWHKEALKRTKNADVVFLDPDNGLESLRMHQCNGGTEKHVLWWELKDYYDRGQNVILYQHRPQMTKRTTSIESIIFYSYYYLRADNIMALEFPKYTNRFYFFFLHKDDVSIFNDICNTMAINWGKNGFCKRIDIIYNGG